MRLIDADKLDKTLFEEIPMAENVSIFHDMIDSTPTAYDVDKVVKELEREIGIAERDFHDTKDIILLVTISEFQKAIKIVRNGGVVNG